MFRKLYAKYKDIIPYGIFGVLTTVINWGSYKLFYSFLGVPNVPSTCIAWLLSVIFAFVTNKLWVFNSKSWERKTVIHEAVSFFSARIATGLLDVLIMWIAVDKLSLNADLWKIISNVIVIAVNYFASKFFIFKKH